MVGKLVATLGERAWSEASPDELAATGIEPGDLVTQPARAGRSVSEQIALLRAAST
jgi:hypothetical protein